MLIRTATIQDAEALSVLFDQYRVFYRQVSDMEAARHFITERIQGADSILLIAYDADRPAGFIQLYPSFTSVGMGKIWILNDLFVSEDYRRKGVGVMLIHRAIRYTKETGRLKLVLSTAYDNTKAQGLYEKLGFEKADFFNYELDLRASVSDTNLN